MVVELNRKDGETFESFLRRFNKKLMRSGRLIQYRKIRYENREPSRNLRKNSALIRKRINERKEYLEKTGKIKEDDDRKKIKAMIKVKK